MEVLNVIKVVTEDLQLNEGDGKEKAMNMKKRSHWVCLVEAMMLFDVDATRPNRCSLFPS